LFVSSPSDVRPERDRVTVVADRLNGALEGVVRIELIRWEDSLYSSTRSFQEQIHDAVAGMADIDILVCILWGRIGLKLDPAIWKREDGGFYESGTVCEYEAALALNRKNSGVPEIYLFRKSAPIFYRAETAAEDIEQHELLETVWRRWTQSREGYNAAAFQTFADTDEFERQIEQCVQQWLERHGILVKGPVWDYRLNGSPFRGLAPFDSSHSAVFFGRDAAIARAVAKLRGASFLLIIGASGSGKSSLLRAGLIPRIGRPGVVPDIDLWRTALILPNSDTFLLLTRSLFDEACLGVELKEAGYTLEQVADLLRQGGEPAEAPLRAALTAATSKRATQRRYAEPRPARLLLAIDQLERLFVEMPADQVEKFAKLLQGFVGHNLAVVIVALRSDAYGSFQAVDSFMALREAGATHDLLAPNTGELEEMVTRPVLACHPLLAFEVDAAGKSLAQVLVADAKGGDAMSLLQMTLERLFQAELARGDGVLRYADYQGIEHAVMQAASEVLASIDPAARASVPALVTALVHDVALDPVSGKPVVTVRPVSRAAFEHGRPERTALVDALLGHRLLTVEQDAGGEVRIRPVHEALLRVWPEGVSILTENQTVIRVRRTLEPLVGQWIDAGRSPESDLLLTSPALLAEARQLIERMGDDVPPPMRDYIQASLAADARRQERERQRRAAIMSATGGLTMRTIPYYRPLVLVLIALAVLVRFLDPGFLQTLRSIAFDTYQQISPAAYDANLPVGVVDIDARSLAAYGQWPWPRTRMSDLAKRLAADGAAAVVFDIVFAEPDQWSVEQYAKTLPPDQARQLRDANGTNPTNDQVFAESLTQAPSAIAVALENAGPAESQPITSDNCSLVSYGKAGLTWTGNCPAPYIPSYTAARVLPVLAKAAKGVGEVDIVPDPDQIVRRISLVARQGNTLFPSLVSEAVRLQRGEHDYEIESANGTGETSYGQKTGINYIDIADLRIPTNAIGELTLKYRHSNSGAFISAAAVLSGEVPQAQIAHRIIFIGLGATTAGLVDLHPTPVDSAVPGVEILEQAAENILGGTELKRPNYIIAVEELIVLAITAMLAVAMPRVPARFLVLLSALLLILTVGGGWAAYNYASLLIDPVYPVLVLVVFIAVVTFHIYRHSEAQRSRIRHVYDAATP